MRNEKLHNLYFLSDIVRKIKLSRVTDSERVIQGSREMYRRFFIRKTEGKNQHGFHRLERMMILKLILYR
jgi:hypothetical protein